MATGDHKQMAPLPVKNDSSLTSLVIVRFTKLKKLAYPRERPLPKVLSTQKNTTIDEFVDF